MGLRYCVSLFVSPLFPLQHELNTNFGYESHGPAYFPAFSYHSFPCKPVSPSRSHSYLIFLPNQRLIWRMLFPCPFHNVIPLLCGYLFSTVITESRAHASLPHWRDMPPHITWRKAISLCSWSMHTAQIVASLLPHSRGQTIALLTLISISAGPRSGMRCFVTVP